MSASEASNRPKLRDILRMNARDFQKTWDATEASSGFDPLPPGVYRCLVTNGGLFTSRTNATPGYKVEFQVIAGPFASRKVWLDVWLSEKALGTAKAVLAKVGITRPEQLEQPLPPGLTADVTVVLRIDDNGATFNRVKTFKVIETDVPAADFRPADLDVERGEGDGGPSDADEPTSTGFRRMREPGDDDDRDDGGFDWRTGVQEVKRTSAPLLDAARNGKEA
jgi:hypothetical protein